MYPEVAMGILVFIAGLVVLGLLLSEKDDDWP